MTGYVGTSTLAKYLGCTGTYARRLCDKDAIEGAVKVRGRWRIPLAWLDAELARRAAELAAAMGEGACCPTCGRAIDSSATSAQPTQQAQPTQSTIRAASGRQ